MIPTFLVCTSRRKNGFREKVQDFSLAWIRFDTYGDKMSVAKQISLAESLRDREKWMDSTHI